MTGRLAVFTNQLGATSETFIRRHIEDLAPGRTVVVARQSGSNGEGIGGAQTKTLFLDQWALRLPVRLAKRAGVSEMRMRDGRIREFLRRNEVSVVFGEYLDRFLDFVPLLEQMGLPYVVQGHGIDVSAALRKPATAQGYSAYQSAKAILTRCEFHRQRLIALGLPAEKVHVNPGGIDVPKAPPKRESGATKRFLAVGRMVPKKGPIFLLESFRQAAIHDRELFLDYIGGGELLPAARQFVQACGLKDRVRLHGTVDESKKEQLWSECGSFLQHSLTDPDTGDEEGLPAAIQEAMANAMIVVTTRHSGISEAIEHGLTGLLSDETDCPGMAANITFAAGGEGASLLRLAAWEKADRNYTWTSEKSRLLKHLGLVEVSSSGSHK